MAASNLNQAKVAAETLIKEHAITEPVVPVFEIAQKMNIEIRFVAMPEELKNVSGFIHPEKKIIYVNEGHPLTRQLFTVAHELGHFVLKHSPNDYKVLMRDTTIEQNNVEREANEFAANLLVPESILKNILRKYSLKSDDIDLLSKIFGVSRDMMRIRIANLKRA